MSAGTRSPLVVLSRPARAAAVAAVLGLSFLLLAAAALAATPPRTSPLRSLPGYVPLVDAESTSVLLGRRTSAPRVDVPFHGGARGLDDLGRRICRYVHHQSADSLLALGVTAEEFRDVLWPEFPQSRPATGLRWEDGWTILYARIRSGCAQAINEHGGEPVQFVRFERRARPDLLARYRNFTLHNGLVMVVRNGAGELERWDWLRAVAERRGVFKIYSTSD